MSPNNSQSFLRRLFGLTFLFLGIPLLSTSSLAATRILVLGGSKAYYSEAAFPPAAVASHLQGILSGDSAVSAPVTVQSNDTYQSDAATGFESRSLMSWYYWPPNHAANLALLSGSWDYVVMIDDPYFASQNPEYHFEGVKRISEEVWKRGGTPVSVMTWSSGGESVDVFGEMAYRVADSLGVQVAPAGYAWNNVPSQLIDSGTRPTSNAAYLTAATLFSKIFGRSAKDSSYIPDAMATADRDTLADTALASVQTEAGRTHYTGTLLRPTHFANPINRKRSFEYADFNSSTEDGITRLLTGVLSQARVSYKEYTSSYQSFPALGRQIDFCQSRFYYMASLAKWQNYACFDYQDDNGSLSMVTGMDRVIFPVPKPEQETGAAYVPGYINRGAFFVPIRVLWARMQELHPEIAFQSDGHHMTDPVLSGIASMMYTLLSGRCPVGDEPSDPTSATWQNWFGRKVGYEVAWQHATLNSRAPGFVVLPSATTATTLSLNGTEKLTVKFIYPPNANIVVTATANVSGDVQISPSTLTFSPANSGTAQTFSVKLVNPRPTSRIVIGFDTQSTDPVFNGLHDEWDYSPVIDYKWDGAGGDDNLSTAANWNPDGGPTPVVYSSMTFDGSSRLNPVNDLSGFACKGITFTSTAGAFTLSGNAITLDGNIGFSANPSSAITQTINWDMALSADRTVTTQAMGNLAFGGVVSGTYKLTKAGSGILTLNGTTSYTNGTVVNGGTLRLGGNERLLSSGTLFVNASTAGFDLNDYNQTLSGLVAASGGTINLGSGTLDVVINSLPQNSCNAALTGSGVFVKDGTGLFALSGTGKFTGTTLLNSGTLILAGPAGSALKGSQAGTSVVVSSGAALSTYLPHQFGWSGTLAKVTLNSGATMNTFGQDQFVSDLSLKGNSAIVGSADHFLGLASGSLSYVSTSGSQQAIIGAGLQLSTPDSAPVNTAISVDGSNTRGDLIINGPIMGNFAGLTKTGTGTLVLTASNTYTGSTQISKGTLALATGTATTIGYIVPVAVTAESWYTPDDRSPIHAIDGSGMSGTNSFSATGNVLVVGKMWMSAQGKVQTWITFDLGAVRTISGFHLWNYNEQTRTVRGVATCGIYSGTSMPANNSSYASNGPAWGSLVQNMTLKPGSDQPSYIGEDYFFSAPVTTRYLQIYVTKNYGDSYYSGISEIGFYTTTATPQAGSLSASSSLNLAAGATLDCSGLGDSAACVLDSNVPFTASGEGTGIGTTAAALRAGVSGTIILGSRPVTFNLPASLTGDDTTHPALYISQGSLSLGKNAFTVNAPTPLDVGTYRLIQVGDGSNGITLDGGSYPPVAGTAVAGKNGAIAISNGNVILKVTDNSYAYWATLHAPGQSPSEDYNHNRIANGIEYFMGASQNVFTPVPAIANGAISWPKSLTFSGSYTVQTSANLKDWTDVPATSLDLSNPAFVRYVVPSGQASLFIRLKVVIAP